MHLPRLRAWLPDDRAAARLLESAIRHEQRVVPLVAPPRQGGPHVLEVPYGGGQVVCVIGEPVGLGRPDGVPLDLRPLDPVQMPDLFALVERLDNPNAHKPQEKPAPVAPKVEPAASGTWGVAARVAEPPKGPAPSAVSAPVATPAATLAATPAATPAASQPSARASRPPAPRPAAGTPASAGPARTARNTAPSLPSPDLYELFDEPADDMEVDVEFDDLEPEQPGPDSAYGGDDAPTLFQQRPPAKAGAREAVPPPPSAPEFLEPTVARTSNLLGADTTVILAKGSRTGAAASAPRREEPPAPEGSATIPVAAGPGPSADLIGHTIAGKYAIESSLGRGQSAEVYRAQHTGLNRAVAVKILHQENQGNAQFVKRFKAEGRTLSRLEHHNIARVIDFGEEPGGRLYLVMELLAGKSLEVLLRTGGKLPRRQVVDIGIQTCSGLAFAHDEGVVHRDVKPDNIVLVPHRDDDGKPCDVVKVCDFGLAKLRSQGGEADNRESDFTLAGALCGSPAYMSPEQLLGEPLDARTDVYALGVTLYEALSGKFPHEGAGLTELFVKKLTAAPASLQGYVPDLDPGLEGAVMRAIARDKTARFADARAFRQELRDALGRM